MLTGKQKRRNKAIELLLWDEDDEKAKNIKLDIKLNGAKRAMRRWRLKAKYGITKEQYSIMLECQNGLCAICNKPELNRELSVDHDHITGKVRSLLCFKCNSALGLVKEDESILLKMIDYLRKHK